MKKNPLFFCLPGCLWSVLLVVFFSSTGAGAEDLGALRLGQMEGEVQIQSVGMDEWLPAATNFPLRTADRLWVPPGALAQIEGREGSVIRLDGASLLEIVSVERNGLQLYLGSGRIHVNFQQWRDFMLQVDTPVSTFRTYDDAIFNVVLDEYGNVDLSVFRGDVLAENSQGEVRVEEGLTYTVDRGIAFLTQIDSLSDWEQWNQEQDKRLMDEDDGRHYLPPELSVHGRDLSRNGRWVATREYGNVWTPTMHVSVGWAPYRYGRWVWIGHDYVWIGDEPWGWVPYHYGRWAHLSSIGWCWVPPRRNEVYWGPGYVSWIQTTSDIGWVPLAPYEIYYGHGDYGPYSVNVVHTTVYRVVPGRHLRNVRVRDAVTVVHRDAFLSGMYRDGRRRDNPFLHEKIHFGRPRLEPQRMTRMPAIREIPREKRPPAHIRSVSGRVGEQAARPLVRDRERSVFHPVSGPRQLSLPVTGVRSEGDRHRRDNANPTETFRDRRHFPERGGQLVSPDDRRRVDDIEKRGKGKVDDSTINAAGIPEESLSPPSPERAPRTRPEERATPPGFQDRRPDRNEDERRGSFRERQERVEPMEPDRPQVAQPEESLSAPSPERAPRTRPEERATPPGFQDRRPDRNEDERRGSFRERPAPNRERPEPAVHPASPQPQVVAPPPVPVQQEVAPNRDQGRRRHSRNEEERPVDRQDEPNPAEGG